MPDKHRIQDKYTKQEIKRVLKKYGSGGKSAALFSGKIAAIPTIGLVGLDLMLTGGIGTAAAAVYGSIFAGTSGLFGIFLYNKLIYTNTAGQTVYTSSVVIEALNNMEKKLLDSFNKASKPTALQDEKGEFLNLAAEITTDAKALFPVFQITAVRSRKHSTDQYEFIVKTEYSAPGREHQITLTDALLTMSRSAASSAPLAPQPKKNRSISDIKKLLQDIDKPCLPPSPKPPS